MSHSDTSVFTGALRTGRSPIIVAQVAGDRDASMISTTYSHLVVSDADQETMGILAPED